MDAELNRVSLHRKDWFDNQNVSNLENYLAKDHCVAFNTVQSAIQACLELMGTREHGLVVILPVTAGPDEMAGVLRSGANPVLLDVDEEYLQLDPNLLSEVMGLLESEKVIPVILLDKPFGDIINPDILTQVQDVPTISIYRGHLNSNMGTEYFPAAFNIMDLTPMVGGGSLVFHGYIEQVKHLKIVRSGAMGMGANLPESTAASAKAEIENQDLSLETYKAICSKYEESALELMPTSIWPAPIWVKVKDAQLVSTQLRSYGIEAPVSFFPLHKLDEISKRFRDEPSYPIAEKLQNRFICVPYHEGALDRTDEIIKIIGEMQ